MKDASVVITVYKRTLFLQDAVRSVVNQEKINRDNLEIIIVTNTSLNKQDYPVDKIIYSDDRTIGQKLYEGIRFAQSDKIFFLEDDDCYFPNKLHTIIPLLDDPDVGYVHNAYVTDSEEQVSKTETVSNELEKFNREWLDDQTFYSFSRRIWRYSGNMSSIAIRKDVVDLEQVSKIKLFPDIYTLPIILLHGKNCIHVNNILTWVRTDKASTTHTMFDREIYKLALQEINSWVNFVSGKSINLEKQARAILTKRRIANGLDTLSLHDLYYFIQYELAARMLFKDIKTYLRNRPSFGGDKGN